MVTKIALVVYNSYSKLITRVEDCILLLAYISHCTVVSCRDIECMHSSENDFTVLGQAVMPYWYIYACFLKEWMLPLNSNQPPFSISCTKTNTDKIVAATSDWRNKVLCLHCLLSWLLHEWRKSFNLEPVFLTEYFSCNQEEKCEQTSILIAMHCEGYISLEV